MFVYNFKELFSHFFFFFYNRSIRRTQRTHSIMNSTHYNKQHARKSNTLFRAFGRSLAAIAIFHVVCVCVFVLIVRKYNSKSTLLSADVFFLCSSRIFTHKHNRNTQANKFKKNAHKLMALTCFVLRLIFQNIYSMCVCVFILHCVYTKIIHVYVKKRDKQEKNLIF